MSKTYFSVIFGDIKDFFLMILGDFEEALIYYSRSISLARTAASVNNRALAYLRLDRYKEALEDCDQVLSLEKENIKAKLRRATALKELSRLEEAKKDLDFVLEIVIVFRYCFNCFL